MDRTEPPVAQRAKGLEDRPVEDVGPDGERRLEAEEQDQQRRQQRSPVSPTRSPINRPVTENSQFKR
jgi:hypothetical protein